ncbi:uncharacterized protein LOC117247667 isoform X1 [Epinephelus lanceolatus]|nr:uncharacterized protein LOC117247667 isoform X5 [Epinephelus lanceolatus]XP_033468163.1 uncharacterized protein LOC117247667 isoform X5 [Epinephelus lanceolatus]
MVVLAVAVSVAPSSCALGCMGSTDSTEMKVWSVGDTTVAAVFKEMESLRCEQTTLQQQQQQNALTQMHIRSSEEDINTLVCGRCRRNKSCVSPDKINWRCKGMKSSSQILASSYYEIMTSNVSFCQEIQKIYTNILNAFSLDPMEIIVGEK